MNENQKRGKRNRQQGANFEKKVREDLESDGWTVDKWSNNIEFLENGARIVKAKNKFLGVGRPMMLGAGFPDFIVFRQVSGKNYEIIGVESKSNGRLSPIEKEKCKWYIDNEIFGEILIAIKSKEKNRIIVGYKNFKDY